MYSVPLYIIAKLMNIKDKEKMLKQPEENNDITLKGIVIKTIADFIKKIQKPQKKNGRTSLKCLIISLKQLSTVSSKRN